MLDKQKSARYLKDILRFIAPGTPIREGIENVLRAKTGGLIVLGYNEKVKDIVDGGFYIHSPFSPAHLYELAKMDGAIILSDSGQKILFANAQLVPDPSIPSSETGMRHRTAERVAKQTGCLVIAISQRRNVITLYHGEHKYSLRDIGVILVKANQAIQTLEKYKTVFDQSIANLNALEFEELVTYGEVLHVLHRIEMVLRIKNEIITYVNELGTEGRLIRLQMSELVTDIEGETMLLIKDYSLNRVQDARAILKQLQDLANFDLLEDTVLFKLLGHPHYTNTEEQILPRGYRILSKIKRLPPSIIDNLVTKFLNLKLIFHASVEQLDEVEGIGEIRARKIKEGMKRMQQQSLIDR
ncbi:DNA integrity scanning protein DisA [Bacillus sp. FJAT-42376]|uniref:DNA integrity scanning diadenylate cyclase DisA n=1 Tax=Bacillus sp. FJAT-42376 TaxID=2014076 RepID=UPI000F51363D|nr:DNA integrity scanning diadenylate cyclase DisA [Bacillus sp. FJAT-42376]AZB41227.1 DNA integrity scanning protein DisA [Bacillus sp. FJAT-42376]